MIKYYYILENKQPFSHSFAGRFTLNTAAERNNLVRLIKVKVKASAKENNIKARGKDSFEISVKEPAENNRANRAACSLLAQALGVPAQKVVLVKGHTSPAKIMRVYE